MSNNILRDREIRYNEVLSLISQYKMPVICGKVNYPGGDKNTREAQKAFKILQEILSEKFSCNSVFIKTLCGDDGSSILIVVNLTALKAKKIAVSLEINHSLGRIFDIDVYAAEGKPVGREDLGMEPRKCIICGEDARICMRIGSHSFQEVAARVNQLICDYIPLGVHKP